MKKQEAIKIITNTAQIYNEKFVGKNFLYIYEENNKYQYVETKFVESAFRHLTGVETKLSANEFFSRCVSRRLSPKDFEFKADGTTKLKMNILPNLFNVNRTYKMIGDYDNSKIKLYTDKVAGGQFGCMGLVLDKGGYYAPISALQEDIRDIVIRPYRIVAIYSKKISDEQYTNCEYLAKKVDKAAIEKFVDSIHK